MNFQIYGSGPIVYITVYRPPEFNALGREYMAMLIECLEYLCNTRDSVILVGDFNLPNIDWALLHSPDDAIHSLFLSFCVNHGLHQYVDLPTRENHTLDLVFSSDHRLVSDLQVVDTFSTSDHCTVLFNVIVRPHDSYCAEPTIIYDFENADYEGIASFLLSDPFLAYPQFDPDEAVDHAWERFIHPLTSDTYVCPN